ncbi:MAG: carbohydrate ABC transporter permease [Lachnospiraceae bacterium]|nr:carbohydrate ABC transporter permease [Lachnospiraceae bacterium]
MKETKENKGQENGISLDTSVRKDKIKVATINEKRHGKLKVGDIIFYTCNAIIMIAVCVITLYPVLNTLAISFNDGVDAVRGGVHLIPRMFTWTNYTTVLGKKDIMQGALISVLRTVIGTLLALAANALLAFIVAQRKFVFRSQLALFWVITMYVNGGMIPTLLLYQKLHLTGTFWVYVIPAMISGFNMLVMRTYMEGLPDSLQEAAEIDGAGFFTIFLKVISPLCKPVYATVALFVAVGQWNSWFDTMLYNRFATQYTTLQYELMKLLSSVTSLKGSTGANTTPGSGVNITPISVRSAATILTMAPIVMLYPFLQRYFVTGLTIGGVKE